MVFQRFIAQSSRWIMSAAVLLLATACAHPNKDNAAETAKTADPLVMAYYFGDGKDLDRYDFNKLTHIIFSFALLDGNKLAFIEPETEAAFLRVAALKTTYPNLKVMVAFGGWGGCETCSDVFSSADNRLAFAKSSLEMMQKHNLDGLDLDWEYPAISGFPDHAYKPEDRENFTELVKVLRETLGNDYRLSFAAGGTDSFIQHSIDWKGVMPLIDNVNLMSYDLYDMEMTGYHSALYSTPLQDNSTDRGVKKLLAAGVAPEKIVIGAAFYSRAWDNVPATNYGVRQPGKVTKGLWFTKIPQTWTKENGYDYRWDDVAKAPYVYNAEKGFFASFDDERSVTEKVKYVREHKLGGIMFWQLMSDNDERSLVDAIHKEVHKQ